MQFVKRFIIMGFPRNLEKSNKKSSNLEENLFYIKKFFSSSRLKSLREWSLINRCNLSSSQNILNFDKIFSAFSTENVYGGRNLFVIDIFQNLCSDFFSRFNPILGGFNAHFLFYKKPWPTIDTACFYADKKFKQL